MSRQLTEQFRFSLEQLDMLDTESPESVGLIFTDSLSANPHERLALEKAITYHADAVYFRRFEDRSVSIPQIYIYDFTLRENEYDDTAICDLHRKLWNSGQVPMFFIFTRQDIGQISE